LAVFTAGLFAWSAPAMADSVTTLSSFSDPRNAMPQRPGHTIKRVRYGLTSSSNIVLQGGNYIHNALRHNAPSPCTNCYITDMVPSLVYVNDANHPDGTPANLNNDAMMHHFVLINRQRDDPVCPLGLQGQIGERFLASGNERSQIHLPAPFGYQNSSSTWSLIMHVINKGSVAKSLNIEVVYQYRTAGASEARPLWLDIDGCADSEYTIPNGYSDTTVDWTSNVTGRLVGLGGHMHDVDVTNSTPCVEHCPEKGHGIAVTAELLGGDSGDYFGPVPPSNPPPASITGATLCRSEGYYGTAWAAGRFRGHLDTASQCMITNDLLPTAQAEAWPNGGELPSTGYPINAGQTIRLHSEYQNDTGQPQTDAMGIMMAWYVPGGAGYPRPLSASPTRVPLVPAYRQCTSPNRTHGPPDFPGNAQNPDGSCNPPVQASSQLTVGTPDSNGPDARSIGSVRFSGMVGNPATDADEADTRVTMSMTDVRNRSGLTDYTGQLQLDTTIRVTDRNNGPSVVGTGQDIPFRVTVPCTGTGGTTDVGSTCSVNTTADAVAGAGAVTEGMRSIWSLGQVRVNDGGADGVAATAPNTLFAVQGVFVP
jgi:hypothetical protein